MYKLINKMYTRKVVVYALLIIVALVSVNTSCKTTKAKRFKNTPNYKATPSAVTKKLFMQYKRANVALPPNEDGSAGTPGQITEKVTIRNQELAAGETDVIYEEGKSKLDTGTVYRLKNVEVVGKSRSTPERDGMITVEFNVVLPKELVSPDWRVVLTPKLLHNDSIVPLQSLVLNGQNFMDKQKKDYEDYDAFLKTLVPKEKYDSVYFDLKGTHKDMVERQNIYWQAFYKEWKHLVEFEKWLVEKGNKDALVLAKDESFRLNRLHENARAAQKETVILMVQNKDTTGVYEKHMQKYDKQTAKIFEKQTGQDYDIKSIPAKFRDLYNSPYSLDDLTNFNFTEQDSIDIARHRYDFEAIVFNEMDVARKDEIFDNMVTYPYFDDKTMFRVDTLLNDANDYIYRYSQDYPVVPGLKSIRITMDGKVQAIDRSSYNLPKTDTLAFFISSLVQLADTSLITKKTKHLRNRYDRQVVYTKYKGKSPAFDDNLGNNKAEINKVLKALTAYLETGTYTVDSITMRVSTSLDGDYTDNLTLSEKRGAALIDYLSKNVSGLNIPSLMKTSYIGEYWQDLANNIKKRNDIVNKTELLSMITNAVQPDATEEEFKKKFPDDYKIIRDSIYPLLNRAEFIIDIHRTGQDDTETVEVEYRSDYEEGIRLLQERQYWEAIEILANYPDYNAALCLVCMGYNQKAEDILKQLTPTDRTEYLYAIITARSNRDGEAVQHLKKACEMNSSWTYRLNLDPDISRLVKQYNLKDQLDRDDAPLPDPDTETAPAAE